MFIFRVVKFFCKEIDIVIIEINKFLIKGVIRKVIYVFGEFILIIFIRFKKDGFYCFILNLKKLNEYIEYYYFKMDLLFNVF